MSLEASPQPLPVSVRMSGVGGARSRFHSFAHLPATAVGTSVLFGVLSFLYQALLVWGTRASTSWSWGSPHLPAIVIGTMYSKALLGSAAVGIGEGGCLFPGEDCFCPSHIPGHSVRAAAQLLHCCCACWTCSGHQTLSAATVPVLSPIPPPLLISGCPPSEAWIFQICLFVERESLHWGIVVWLVNLRGEIKVSSHFAMILISPCVLSFNWGKKIELHYSLWYSFQVLTMA